jgi:hypothetical protein
MTMARDCYVKSTYCYWVGIPDINQQHKIKKAWGCEFLVTPKPGQFKCTSSGRSVNNPFMCTADEKYSEYGIL